MEITSGEDERETGRVSFRARHRGNGQWWIVFMGFFFYLFLSLPPLTPFLRFCCATDGLIHKSIKTTHQWGRQTGRQAKMNQLYGQFVDDTVRLPSADVLRYIIHSHWHNVYTIKNKKERKKRGQNKSEAHSYVESNLDRVMQEMSRAVHHCLARARLSNGPPSIFKSSWPSPYFCFWYTYYIGYIMWPLFVLIYFSRPDTRHAGAIQAFSTSLWCDGESREYYRLDVLYIRDGQKGGGFSHKCHHHRDV